MNKKIEMFEKIMVSQDSQLNGAIQSDLHRM